MVHEEERKMRAANFLQRVLAFQLVGAKASAGLVLAKKSSLGAVRGCYSQHYCYQPTSSLIPFVQYAVIDTVNDLYYQQTFYDASISARC